MFNRLGGPTKYNYTKDPYGRDIYHMVRGNTWAPKVGINYGRDSYGTLVLMLKSRHRTLYLAWRRRGYVPRFHCIWFGRLI